MKIWSIFLYWSSDMQVVNLATSNGKLYTTGNFCQEPHKDFGIPRAFPYSPCPVQVLSLQSHGSPWRKITWTTETKVKAWSCSFVSLELPEIVYSSSAKRKGYTRTDPCSLCVRRSRRIERKLAFWVFGLLLGAGGQGSMPPGRTRRNQELRRYPTHKGSPDAKRFSGRNQIGY